MYRTVLERLLLDIPNEQPSQDTNYFVSVDIKSGRKSRTYLLSAKNSEDVEELLRGVYSGNYGAEVSVRVFAPTAEFGNLSDARKQAERAHLLKRLEKEEKIKLETISVMDKKLEALQEAIKQIE